MSMINCPECNQEISDKAKTCPKCGYPSQTNKVSSKKGLLMIGFVVVVAIVIAIIFFTKSSGNVTGEWIVSHYLIESKEMSTEEIGDYYGTNYRDANNAFKVVFNSDGSAVLSLPTYNGSETQDVNCDYEVSGGWITLTTEGESIKAFKIDGDNLIAYKVANYNGEVVLKKK